MHLPFRRAPPSPTPRQITPLNPLPHYGLNAVKTSKYNLLTMLPFAVFEQFRRLSNFYFLIVAAVSFIPDISPSSPVTTTLPLLVVVGFGLARDVWEDLNRRRDDAAVNSAPILVYRTPETKKGKDITTDVHTSKFFGRHSELQADRHAIVEAKRLMVGDVVLVKRDQPLPADILLMYASEGNTSCYVSTANLDGESNLKRKLVPNKLQGRNELKVEGVEIVVPPPTDELYVFEGVLRGDGDREEPLGSDSLLLRGCILRNTEYIYGLVVYNGRDTKLARNMREPPSKLGGIERMMNRVVVGLFIILSVVTVIVAVLAGVWQGRRGKDQWYMGDFRNLSGLETGFRSLGTFLILFHTFVPVSLFVTLEFVRIIQGLFIEADVRMRSKGVGVTAKSNNLNESLGYVEHVFSDKTGTLTENVMEFVACSAGGRIYDERERKGAVRSAVINDENGMRELVRAMALAHDVVPFTTEQVEDETYESGATSEKGSAVKFQGESPDEVALVQAAFEGGMDLATRDLGEYLLREVDFPGLRAYKLLAKLEFTSDRKRMSTVLRCPDGRVRIFSKGADSVMSGLLESGAELSRLAEDTDRFSREGLRTLVYASRIVSEDEYERWASEFAEAAIAMSNRAEKVAKVAAAIEQRLEFLGVTAVEDKLQPNVPSTIKFLRDAGLRLWVLTGDKRETAENIGYSSQLLDWGMNVVHIDCKSLEELKGRFEKVLSDGGGDTATRPHRRSHSGVASDNIIASITLRSSQWGEIREMALIIDGKSLSLVAGEELEQLFLEVAGMCKTVICARVTPLQKATIVKLIRKYEHSHTLAIGDGGNDVSMIQEAHIGVGIKGKEGTQAARAADYSMAEFQHLRRLIACHGRFSYIRTAGVINLSFYKNLFFSLTQIYFQFFCFASGTTLHDQWIVTAWNSILTLLPPFLYGLFERDLEESTVLRFPSVYQSNRNNRLFSMRTVLEYIIAYSLWHGSVLFFMTFFYFGRVYPIVFPSGHDAGFYLTGLAVSTIAVPVALSKFLLSSHLWAWPVLVGSGVSFALLWALIPVFVNLAHEVELEGVLPKLFSSPTYHLLWPIVFVCAFIPDFLVIMLRMNRKSNVVGQLQRFESMQSDKRLKFRKWFQVNRTGNNLQDI